MLPVVPALLHAALIAVDAAPGMDCPSPEQVGEAVEARLPGVLVPVAPLAGSDVWRLSLSTEAAAGSPIVQLVDRRGRVLLRRSLPLPPSGERQRDCPALADSVALIVERYLQELEYRGGAGADAGDGPGGWGDGWFHRWDSFAGASWRPGGPGGSAYELRAGASRAFGATRRLAVGVAAGVEGASSHQWQGGQGSLRRFPFEARLAWRQPAGRSGRVEAGPTLGIELLSLDAASSSGTARPSTMVVPTAGLLGGWRFFIGSRAFVRVVAQVALAMTRYEFALPGAAGDVAFGTPRAYGKVGVEAGLSFW